MKIAIVGTGISGLAAAWLLRRRHDVRVFEKSSRHGGHANTVVVERNGRRLALDTGFLVYNRVTYPNLVRLFEVLGVESKESDMSFSVRCDGCALEYSGSGVSGLFAQRSNLLRPAHYGMLAEIVRFNAIGRRRLDAPEAREETLSSFLEREGLNGEFRRHYLFPMSAALWSSGTSGIADFPSRMLLRFFQNHGLLGLTTHFRWRTVAGGSRAYVEAIARDLEGRLHADAGVTRVVRSADDVALVFADGGTERFDEVVIATHADEALALLDEPTRDERRLLSPWAYSRNETLLHTDSSLLPRRAAARASWNYALVSCGTPSERATVSYLLNRLQGLDGPEDYLVSLNPVVAPRDGSVLARMTYTHPVFSLASAATQAELPSLNGVKRTHFAGAYFGYGFHEDGLVSAIRVAERLGAGFP